MVTRDGGTVHSCYGPRAAVDVLFDAFDGDVEGMCAFIKLSAKMAEAEKRKRWLCGSVDSREEATWSKRAVTVANHSTAPDQEGLSDDRVGLVLPTNSRLIKVKR